MCWDEFIEVMFLGESRTMNKTSLGILVVLLDVSICFSFLGGLYILESFENIENHQVNKRILKVENFAVTVTNLPS